VKSLPISCKPSLYRCILNVENHTNTEKEYVEEQQEATEVLNEVLAMKIQLASYLELVKNEERDSGVAAACTAGPSLGKIADTTVHLLHNSSRSTSESPSSSTVPLNNSLSQSDNQTGYDTATRTLNESPSDVVGIMRSWCTDYCPIQ